MTDSEFTLVAKDYGHLAPLALGDVQAEGFRIVVDRDTNGAVGRTLEDRDVMIGESSISRHVARVATGDTTWVGIPYFLMRGFRHRCFIVRKNDARNNFQDLVGGRIGTDNWMASGNTWSRAAIREQGVGIDQFEWIYGPVEGEAENRPQGNLPVNASRAPEGHVLKDMLMAGDLDAMMIPDPPQGFYEPDSPYRRLFRDFRSVEASYFDRTGMWPGLHITVVRRCVFEQHPTILGALFDALEASRVSWMRCRHYLNETPWMLEEFENSAKMLGNDLGANGFAAIEANVNFFCSESLGQGLIDRRVEAKEVFAEFLEAAPGR
jgi:4,5-dihydroxyphthalate decarboxylase